MEKYIVRPLEHLLDLSKTNINSSYLGAGWPTLNMQVDQNRVKRRWCYRLFRSEGSGRPILGAYSFKYASTDCSLVLTDTDLLRLQTGASETFSYVTDTYTTGNITSVTDVNPSVVTGATTDFTTCAAGDKFILGDDHSANIEPDANWGTIASVTDADTLTLTAKYTGTVDPAVAAEAYKIRRIFTAPPTGERYNVAAVAEKFCFTHRNINVQQYTGTGYTSDLNATSATNAKYCIAYANRLFLADMVVAAVRKPFRVMYSKEGDPTDWTDASAGAIDFIETGDRIQGFGVVGAYLMVYQDNGYSIGQRTGDSVTPVIFPDRKSGVGVKAPYSIIHFMGTNAFLGRDDFYVINGDEPESIGERIRHKFFDMVADAELQNVWGAHDIHHRELVWYANTDEGQRAFVWNYKTKEWGVYAFSDNIRCSGEI